MMRNSASLAFLVLGLTSCGSQTETPAPHTGGVGGGHTGLSGTGGLTSATSSGGASGMSSGSPGGSAGAAASSGGGVAEGNSGAGAATSGGTTGAGGTGGSGQGDSNAGSAGAHASGGAGAGGGPAAGSGGGGQSCAGRSSPAAGDSKSTLQFGGRARTYLLHVPSGLAAGAAIAVVLDLHGAGGNGAQQKGMSGFSVLADKHKFLAVFPDGVDGYWNVDDTCCGTAGKQKIDDVGPQVDHHETKS
jgi:hypothetical protein